MFEDPQIQHLKVAQECDAWQGGTRTVISQPVTLERTPANIARTAPGWGEHTDEVLHEAGYSTSDIEALRAAHAV